MIYAILGGLGAGKTLLNVYMALSDLADGKKIFTNIKFSEKVKNYKNITYLTKETIPNLLQLTHDKKIDLSNATIVIQEMHNYMDSRRKSKQSIMLSYFILQSRHFSKFDEETGKLISTDLTYDTQHLGQVDIRLRRSTDCFIYPEIISRDFRNVPSAIAFKSYTMIKNSMVKGYSVIDLKDTARLYDTHEIVDFDYGDEKDGKISNTDKKQIRENENI